MALFKLKAKCGNHIGPADEEGNRITYKAGDTISSEENLAEKYPQKFILLQGSGSAQQNVPVAPKIQIPKRKGKKEEKIEYNRDGSVYRDMEDPVISSNESEHGIDVTENFPTASEAGLHVFEKARWFTVVDPDDGEVLNEKKLRKKAVKSFLEDYLTDDDDDTEEDDEDEEEE